MGRDYAVEIDALPATYGEAVGRKYSKEDIEAFRATLAHPLVVTGVGGSIAACELAASLHREFTRLPARVASTLQMAEEGVLQGESCVVMTASGRNKDVLHSFDAAAQTGAAELLIVTANADSPIAQRAEKQGYPHVFDIQCTIRKDGFLATNTLLATCTHVIRCWAEACNLDPTLPATIEALLGSTFAAARKAAQRQANAVSGRPIFLVLHAGNGSSGAIDFEARINEGGLGTVHLADARMFAHGRHNWLAAHLDEVAVIAFGDQRSRRLLDATLGLLPKKVPQLKLSTTDDSAGRLRSIISSMLLTESLGHERGVNPGRPIVSNWGRSIYSLGPKGVSATHEAHAKVPPAPAQALGRQKADRAPHVVKGLVLDVDGTILERRERRRAPPAGIMQELNRLLGEGCIVGFATGRGKSLHHQIFKGHIAEKYASQVVLGYYNGTILQSFSDGDPKLGDPDPLLAQLKVALERHNDPPWFDIEDRPTQLTANARNPGNAMPLGALVQALVHELKLPLAFGHSTLGLDIFPASAGKPRVVEAVAKKAGIKADDVVRLGDMGAINGNDFPMLNHASGYTVWLTTPHGQAGHLASLPTLRGPQAALVFLRTLHGPNSKSRRSA